MNQCPMPTLRIVVLAAGYSRRLGQPKALAVIRGTSLLRRTLDRLAPFSAAAPIIVVVPPATRRYAIEAGFHAVTWVVNERRAEGLASSVRLGIARARHSAAVLLVPVDLAELSHSDIARLIAGWRGARRRVIAAQLDGGAAIPLIVPRWLYERARLATGDRGLKSVLGTLPRTALRLLALRSAVFDVDTREDLLRARRRIRPGHRRGVTL